MRDARGEDDEQREREEPGDQADPGRGLAAVAEEVCSDDMDHEPQQGESEEQQQRERAVGQCDRERHDRDHRPEQRALEGDQRDPEQVGRAPARAARRPPS